MTISLIILVLFVINNSFGYEECPEEWTQITKKCFTLIDEKMSFESADRKCRSFGAELLTAKTQLQNKYIVDLIYKKWSKNVDVWLGARKVGLRYNEFRYNTNGSSLWVWTDFTEVTFFNWAPNQPNSNGRQHCMEMVRDHRINYQWPAGTWNDIGCNELNAVVCQAHPSQLDHLVSKHSNHEIPNRNEPNILKIFSAIYRRHSVLVNAILSLIVIILALILALYISRNYYLNFRLRFEKPKADFGFHILRGKMSISREKLNSSNISLISSEPMNDNK